MTRVPAGLGTWRPHGGFSPCSSLPVQPDTIVTRLVLTPAVKTRWFLFTTGGRISISNDIAFNVEAKREDSLPFDFARFARPGSPFIKQMSALCLGMGHLPTPFTGSSFWLWRARPPRTRHCTSAAGRDIWLRAKVR